MFGLKIGITDLLLHALMTLPYSRLMEKEADMIGMDTMVDACIPPAACVALWSRMASAKKSEGKLAVMLSTHPTSEKRAQYMEEALPAKQATYESRCGDATAFRAAYARR